MTATARMKKPVTAALIVAGGSGTRCGGGLPKQYRPLDGIPAISHTLRVFLEHENIDHIQVVHGVGHEVFYTAATAILASHPQHKKILPAVHGGKTRQNSVLKGLEALAQRKPDRVLIHDAARVLLPPAVIDAVCGALCSHEAVLPATPVTDTLKRACAVTETVLETVDRSALWQAQTPQGFLFETVYAAHRAAQLQEATDDIALVEQSGTNAKIVSGHPHNFKLTTPEDFILAEALLQQRRSTAEPAITAEQRYG